MNCKKNRIVVYLLLFVFSFLIFTTYGCKKHTHSYANEWYKDGTYHWQACSECMLTRNKVEHDWNTGIITLQPTEMNEGVRTFTCNTCGQTKVVGIPVLNPHTHKFSKDWMWNETHHWHEATCEHTNEKIEYEKHNWDIGVITIAPTNISKGMKTYTCDTCGKTKSEEIPELSDGHVHIFNQKNTDLQYIKSKATCMKKAVYYYSCSCGFTGTETFEFGNVLNHKFTNYISNHDATCTNDGTKKAICDICGIQEDTIVDIGSAKGHSYSNEWSIDEMYHWHSAICEHVYEYTDKETHIWDSGIITKEPTKTIEGEKTYICEVCNKTKVVNIGILGHAHTYDTEYTFDDNYHWYQAICGHSSEVKGREVHNWDSEIIEFEATVYDEGIKLYTCQGCKHTKEEIIDKIPSFTVIFYNTDDKAISIIKYPLSTPSYQIAIPKIQAETGTKFDKWVEVTSGKSISEINFKKAEENTVYNFKPFFIKAYEVLFMDYEGNQLGEKLFVLEGQTIRVSDLPQIPERTGYTSNWNSIVGLPINENMIFTPVYEVVTLTVTFLDSKDGNELARRIVDYGSFAIIPEFENYKLTNKLLGFTGWKSSVTDLLIDNVEGNKIINIYSDLVLYAAYEESIEEPIIAFHIEDKTVTISLCLPDNNALYSINLSMSWATEIGISTINSISVANPTYLDEQYCSAQNVSVHIDKDKWFTYNNKTQTFDFVWGCGSGHNYNVDMNTITINFGVQGFAKINKESFSILEGSSIVYGKKDASIDDLKKTSIKIWFY